MNGFDLSNITNCYVGGTQASAIYYNTSNDQMLQVWPSSSPTHDYSQDYLTLEALEAGTISFTPYNNNVLYYSTDNGSTWNTYSSEISVGQGDKVICKGNMTSSTAANNYYGVGKFGSTSNINACGNAMSLLYGDNFVNQLTLSNRLAGLFYGCTTLVDAHNLVLPATTLVDYCYLEMFYGCTSLTTINTIPTLPATTLSKGCYISMFSHCTSLVTGPILSATTMAESCYKSMFSNCTSLTTAPALPATTLAPSCYYNMFISCTSLTTAPDLLAQTLATEAYTGMFKSCWSLNYIKMMATEWYYMEKWVMSVASTGTFVKDANTSMSTSDNGIPFNWTVQNI